MLPPAGAECALQQDATAVGLEASPLVVLYLLLPLLLSGPAQCRPRGSLAPHRPGLVHLLGRDLQTVRHSAVE